MTCAVAGPLDIADTANSGPVRMSTQLEHEVRGEGAEHLLLIHGWMTSREVWAQVAELLAGVGAGELPEVLLAVVADPEVHDPLRGPDVVHGHAHFLQIPLREVPAVDPHEAGLPLAALALLPLEDLEPRADVLRVEVESWR